jgi:hypothetical protein
VSHQRGATPSLYFSDHFGVSRQIVLGYGAFDISLVADLPLFVDPFLLFASRKPEYRKLHDGIIDDLPHRSLPVSASIGASTVARTRGRLSG